MTSGDYQSAQRKIDGIQNDRLRPGARVELTPSELNAYAEHNLPAGVRNPQVRVTAPEVVTGSAMVDSPSSSVPSATSPTGCSPNSSMASAPLA